MNVQIDDKIKKENDLEFVDIGDDVHDELLTVVSIPQQVIFQPALERREEIQKNLHVCVYCKNEFEFVCRLRDHIKQNHGERDIRCPIDDCDKTFAIKKHLAAHLKRVHMKSSVLNSKKTSIKNRAKGKRKPKK